MKTNGIYVFSMPMPSNITQEYIFYCPGKNYMTKKRKMAIFIEFCPLPSMLNFKRIFAKSLNI